MGQKISPLMPIKINFPQNSYSQNLTKITQINFTRREIDIISCIINGRASKRIAVYLSLSPRTIERYIADIMTKINCNSREGIIDFIEKSGKINFLRMHYQNILIQLAFEKSFTDCNFLAAQDSFQNLILYIDNDEQYKLLLNKIRSDFKNIDVNIIFKSIDYEKTFQQTAMELQSEDRHIYLLAHELSPCSDEELEAQARSLFTVDQKRFGHNNNVFILLVEKKSFSKVDSLDPNLNYLDLAEDEDEDEDEDEAYHHYLEILKKICPTANVEKQITTFTEQIEKCQSIRSGGNQNITIEKEKSERKSNYNLRKPKLGSRTLSSTIGKTYAFLQEKQIKIRSNPKAPFTLIRADLFIPADSILLARPEVFKKIDQNIKGCLGIRTIGLIGIGGTGKTTLARLYARSQPVQIIWEINAENRETLWNSIENLAYALCQNVNDRKILNGVMKIEKGATKNQQIRMYIAKKLRHSANWILIFDNVAKFSELQEFFPQDPDIWGAGIVILTTRNANLVYNINTMKEIYIDLLTDEEKTRLFNNIMLKHNSSNSNFLLAQDIPNFLKEIPPYPFDVTVAAHHLKSNHTICNEYINNLYENDRIFNKTQEHILNETTNYKESRYNIITIPLKKIISKNEHFKDLLLFISIMNYKNISINLLSCYKNRETVDQLIYELKEYSLISRHVDQYSGEISISLNKSTKKIMYNYFLKTIKSGNVGANFNKKMKEILNICDKYILCNQ